MARATLAVLFIVGILCSALCNTDSTNENPCRTDISYQHGCHPNNDTSAPVCSGRGICICGVCECEARDNPEEVISGVYCECDNFSCVTRNGLMCSGRLHGECVCGKCVCAPGYMQNKWGDCACSLDQSTCVAPGGILEDLCNGHGKCKCGRCDCDPEFYGRYCELCPTCPDECGDIKECVECEAYGSGPLYKAEAPEGRRCGNCSLSPDIVQGNIEDTYLMDHEQKCTFLNDHECMVVFSYYYDNLGDRRVRAQKNMKCPEKSWLSKIADVFG